MSDLGFEWDARKEAANRRKHGVSFHEATTVFSDDQALIVADTEHSAGEDRYLLLGRAPGRGCLSFRTPIAEPMTSSESSQPDARIQRNANNTSIGGTHEIKLRLLESI